MMWGPGVVVVVVVVSWGDDVGPWASDGTLTAKSSLGSRLK